MCFATNVEANNDAPQRAGEDGTETSAAAKADTSAILDRNTTTSTRASSTDNTTNEPNGSNIDELSYPNGHAEDFKTTSVIDCRTTNLGHFQPSVPFESLESTCFTMLQRISPGINGDIFKYEWYQGEEKTVVAVKKLRNSTLQRRESRARDERYIHTKANQISLNQEDALTEIGILQYLSKQQDVPLYLLKMQGVFSGVHQYTWLVTEFANGGELFDVAAAGGLTEDRVQDYMRQLLIAVEYLHRHYIGHRDISLENVLLKDDTVRLMDFGMAVQSHSPSGIPLRYYREVGKAFYRAPECYVPSCDQVPVTTPCSAEPGDIVMTSVSPNFLCEVRLPQDAMVGKFCLADVWGYAAAPADVFALGVCMFVLAFQCPPWEFARPNNRYFKYAYNSEDGIASLLKLWGKQHLLSTKATSMMSSMMRTDPTKRPSVTDCLDHSWFDFEV